MKGNCVYIFIITYTHIVFSQRCTRDMIAAECKVNVVCSGNYIDIRVDYLVLHQSSQYYDFCRAKSEALTNPYYVGVILPMYVRFSQITPGELPNFYNTQMRDYTYSLDFDSTSGSTPTFVSMPNLHYLRISNNNLDTAKLYNIHKLQAIRELDLSYNSISDIEVNRDQYPYTTLTKINLSHNSIIAIPDGIFYGFDALESIDLSFNQIDILSASTFEGVRNLLELNLEDNSLTHLNASLFRFSKLKSLNLRSNKIINIAPNDFDKLQDLESLDLNSNMIQKFNMNVLQHTVSLKKFDIASNYIENIEKDSYTFLKYLTEFDISNNKLKSLPIGLFANMSITTFAINDNILEGSLRKGMLEGLNVQELNLGNQYVTEINDYAFYNTNKLEILLLNSNKIGTLSDMCFRSLQFLQELNLSFNRINNINFNKIDLINLRQMLLRGNNLIQITRTDLQDLTSLEYLDLAENFIVHMEPSSFERLGNLINLDLFSNSMNGSLQTNSFKGLNSLPRLDLAGNFITMIDNASFSGMSELKHLNISRGKIIEIQYNAFIYTGFIEVLDLSFNSLDVFFVNLTELIGLNVLLLNNNQIKTLSSATFDGLSSVTQLDVSYNDLQSIDDEAFIHQVDLHDLNLSFNEKLQIPNKLTDTMKLLLNIDVSGIKTGLNISQFRDLPVSVAKITDANIKNLTKLNVKTLSAVKTLILKNNIVSKLEIGAFSGMHGLNHLDLSCNLLDYIQPGVFKDNPSLHTLNISHNSLLTISYGIFRGLINLNTLDLSYNNISDLQNERLYEVKSLSILIADHNKIASIDLDEFEGTSLTELSIGDNPLPCKDLIKLKNRESHILITALTIDENNHENFEGIKCNRYLFEQKKSLSKNISLAEGSSNVLNDIRDILHNLDRKTVEIPNTNEDRFIEKFDDLQKLSYNITSALLSNNILLEKIFYSFQNKPMSVTQQPLLPMSVTQQPLLPMSVTQRSLVVASSNVTESNFASDNVTENLGTHVNKMYQELQLMLNDKINNIKQSIDEMSAKFSSYSHQAQSMKPKNERLMTDNGQRSIFTEACVAIILMILVCTLIYKFYKSRVNIRNRLSISTRELPGAIENSNL